MLYSNIYRVINRYTRTHTHTCVRGIYSLFQAWRRLWGWSQLLPCSCLLGQMQVKRIKRPCWTWWFNGYMFNGDLEKMILWWIHGDLQSNIENITNHMMIITNHIMIWFCLKLGYMVYSEFMSILSRENHDRSVGFLSLAHFYRTTAP